MGAPSSPTRPPCPSAPVIAATATALPRHRYAQRDLVALTRTALRFDADAGLVERFFRRAGVRQRYLALPAEAYATLDRLSDRNRAWLEVGLELAEQVTRAALSEADVAPAEIGEVISTTVTGIAVPSLEARLMNRVPLARSARRVPLFGLGCAAGAAGVARAADYLRAYPTQTALLLSVELCSLTVQRDDTSIAAALSAGLFGDGAACALLAGADHPLGRRRAPAVLDSRSVFFPDTERLMGWEVVDSGFRILLGPGVPDVARHQLGDVVRDWLATHRLDIEDVAAWVTHPGGPKVLDGLAAGLGLPAERLEPARRTLAEVGNLSSASVLFVLDAYRREPPPPGSYGVMIAMGPAFCAELVLLRW